MIKKQKLRCSAILASAALALLLAGCTSGPSAVTLTSTAQQVKVLPDKKATAGCRSLGKVTGPPPYIFPADGKNRMLNRTAAKGGNALLITNYTIGTATGIAYKCR